MKVLLILTIVVAAISANPLVRSFRRPSPRITYGDDAKEGQIPYQVSYQHGLHGSFQPICGGSIVSETWVVTAGHCITQISNLGDFRVIVGITLLSKDTPEKQIIKVIDKFVHPEYQNDVGPFDIALLKLEKPIKFGKLVQPIKLPAANFEAIGDAVLSGWGSVSTIDFEFMPDNLQTATLPILSTKECYSTTDKYTPSYEVNHFDGDSNICTGNPGRISGCSGDSGGPLALNGTLVGVVSWAFIPCGQEGAPTVFTDVRKFIDFIKEHVTDLPQTY